MLLTPCGNDFLLADKRHIGDGGVGDQYGILVLNADPETARVTVVIVDVNRVIFTDVIGEGVLPQSVVDESV